MMKVEAQFSELYEEYYGFVRCNVLKDLGDGTPDFEDVIGDVYLSLWRILVTKQFRGECSFKTLIYQVTHRRVVDLIRWRVRTKNKIRLDSSRCFYTDAFEKRFEDKELLRLHKEEKMKPRKRKKRKREFENNNYDESQPTVVLPWWGYLSYFFKPF